MAGFLQGDVVESLNNGQYVIGWGGWQELVALMQAVFILAWLA